MLQWMGGSRRKVTTSRKSTQNRQKQYFEQRKRQQQLTAGLDTYADHKEHRSLDILNFLNLSTAHEHKSPHAAGTTRQRREDLEVNASSLKYHFIEEPPKTFANTTYPADSVILKEVEISASDQVQTSSPRNPSATAADNLNSAYEESNRTPDAWKTSVEQQICVFDLLGDDGLGGNFERSPVHEAHVAFSVEGLGKVGTQTPVHSPQTPRRIFQYGCSSPQKVARKLNSSKNSNYLLNDLELEVDLMEKDMDMHPNGHDMHFSTGIMNSNSNLNQQGPIVNNCTLFDGHGSKIRSSFGDSEIYYDDDLWDGIATSDMLDDNFFDVKEDNVCGKNRPFHMEGIDFRTCANEVIPDYAVDCPLLRKNRRPITTDVFSSILESPSLKQRTSENNSGDLIKSERSRYPAAGSSKCKVTSQPDWCYYEDSRDDLSLLSEESCSSSAVMGEATKKSPRNSMGRLSRRRRKNTSGSIGDMYDLKNISAKETLNQNRFDTQQQKYPRMPTLSKLEQFSDVNFPANEKYSPPNRSLFEKGCSSVDTVLDFSPFCQVSKRKLPSQKYTPWAKDAFSEFPVHESNFKAKSSFDGTVYGESVERLGFDSSLDEEFLFKKPFSHFDCHDSPTFLQIEFEPIKPNLSIDSESGDTGPDSFLLAGSCGETLLSNMFARSFSADEENKSKFSPFNGKKGEEGKQNCTKGCLVPKKGQAMEALDPKDILVGCKETKEGTLEIEGILKSAHSSEHAQETSSSVKIPVKFDTEDADKECCNKSEISLHTNDIKGIEEASPDQEKMPSKRPANQLDSSNQVMMLGSYVLQFLCVQKVLKDASAKDAMKENPGYLQETSK